MTQLHLEVEAVMVKIEAKPLALRNGFRHWVDAIGQANMRAAITGRRYAVRRTTGLVWWLFETTKRVPIRD
jgi:hypothetical protein